MNTPLLILIHIPKTGGTTLSRAIRLRLALAPNRWFAHQTALGFYNLGYSDAEDLERRYRRIESLSPRQRARVRFFAAHAGIPMVERLPAPAHAITMLRDPVQRVISTWKYLRKLHAIDDSTSIEQFALGGQQVHPFFVDNAQVRYLGAENGRFIDGAPGTCPPEALETACLRVEHQIFFTGITERFDESLLLLTDALGWRAIHYARARVTSPPSGDAGSLSPALQEAIEERNALDAALYQFALERLEQRIVQAGPNFKQRLAAYQSRNRVLGRLLSPVTGGFAAIRRRTLRGRAQDATAR